LLISQQQWLQSGLTWKLTHCSVVCLSFSYHVVNKTEVIIEMCWRDWLFNVFSSPSESKNQSKSKQIIQWHTFYINIKHVVQHFVYLLFLYTNVSYICNYFLPCPKTASVVKWLACSTWVQ
jgi:hypothetical protein